MFITAVPNIKLFAWGEWDSGGHVLREATSRGLCGLVCPSRTVERGGEGDCVKEGGGGERERERVLVCRSFCVVAFVGDWRRSGLLRLLGGIPVSEAQRRRSVEEPVVAIWWSPVC
jgi:hypothetical protein